MASAEEVESPALYTAFRVLKGAVTKVLRVPNGQTTNQHKTLSPFEGVLSVKAPADAVSGVICGMQGSKLGAR